MVRNLCVIVSMLLLVSANPLAAQGQRDTKKDLSGKGDQTYTPDEMKKADSSSPSLEETSGPLTFRQAISLALLKNPGLSAFAWEVRAKEAAALQAGLYPNPSVGVEVENVAGQGIYSGTNAAETTLFLSQLFLLGGKIQKRRQVALLDHDLAGWDCESLRLNVLSQASKSFIKVLAAQERLVQAEQFLSIAERSYGAVTDRVESGKVSPIEETRASVALYSARVEQTTASQELEASRKKLAATWGGAAPAFSKAVGSLEVMDQPLPFEKLANLIDQNPDLARWTTELEQRKAALELARAKRIPDLTLNAGVRNLQEMNDNAFVFGLTIPIPVFDRNQGGIQEAAHELNRAKDDKVSARIQVLAVLAESYQALAASYSAAKTLEEKILPAAQKALDAIDYGYKQGKFGFLELLDTQRTLFQVRRQRIDTLSMYHLARIEVERLVGYFSKE